jgi:hypothetical protein
MSDIKKLMEAYTSMVSESVEIDEASNLDPVNPKAVKKKFDDRKDKDIDNDGDTDSSDEYLHKRRKAISKSMKDEAVEIEMDDDDEKGEEDGKMKSCPDCDGSMKNHSSDCPRMSKDESCGSKGHKKMKESVSHSKFGYGEVIEETEDGLNIYFEHGIEFNVDRDAVTFFEAKKIEKDDDDPCWDSHVQLGTKKKNGKEVPNCVPKEEVEHEETVIEEGTVAEFEEQVVSAYAEQTESLLSAIEQVWEAAVKAKQGSEGKHKETAMGPASRHNSGDAMQKDHDYEKAELVSDDEDGHEDATKAGRAVKSQAPKRGGESRYAELMKKVTGK